VQTDVTEEEKEKLQGIPFPGTYVVDESGVVIEKYFQRSYATRPSAGTLVNGALAKIIRPEDTPKAGLEENGVTIEAFLADKALYLEYMTTLCVRIELNNELHIYGAPVPEGYIATSVTILESKGIRPGEPQYPKTTPRRFDALNETLNVYEGVVEITVPITADVGLLNWNKLKDKPDTTELRIEVQYQACSETTCFPPQKKIVSLDVPLEIHLYKRPDDPA
jgi:DsbC/DsbD-like thiol-disulfide interchange protein